MTPEWAEPALRDLAAFAPESPAGAKAAWSTVLEDAGGKPKGHGA
ncbi:hypothetical protein LX86_009432 [Lentzea aerocolonigenes]|nr:hypothetical protein [Lentzea aerocolonigenes]